MKRLWAVVWLVLLAPMAARAETPLHVESLDDRALIVALQALGTVRETELALMAASDLLTRNRDAADVVIHGALGRYAARVKGLRAILVTDGAGLLTLDSFAYPAATLNLRDRGYIAAALRAEDDRLILNPTVIGRTSGLPFVPISRALFNSDGVRRGTLVGVLTPDRMLPIEIGCDSCIMAVMLEGGSVLASAPTGARLPEAYGRDIDLALADGGRVDIDQGPLKVETAWRRVGDYPLIAVFARIAPRN